MTEAANIQASCIVKLSTNMGFGDIKKYASVIEKRLDDDYCTLESVLKDNAEMLERCQEYKVNYILLDDTYEFDIKL